MDNLKDLIDNTTKKIEEMGDVLDEKVSLLLVEFDTLLELHKEERLETQKLHNTAMEKQAKHYHRIIAALSVLLIAFAVGLGGMAYAVLGIW